MAINSKLGNIIESTEKLFIRFVPKRIEKVRIEKIKIKITKMKSLLLLEKE